ncbi:MAG: tRNA guanosine(34) transglycosylase Tgt [Bryobacteraceae bacterium]|nr:tRNA guanosine(34) transglycosylase Tgt [Bryobacteraceae bacterium]
MHFEIEAVCPDTGARAGRLHTPHGVIETPIFMPVGTQGTVKGVTPQQLLEEVDPPIILGNTYHLYLRPGHETIERLGGLHQFMQWPRAILTDSGGFQVWSLSGLRKISAEGVLFQSHLNGDRHLFTPESTVDVQLALGSDIMMVLDECVGYPAKDREVRAAMDRTIDWAKRAFAHYRGARADRVARHALFPIVQGGMDPSLRRACAEQLVALDAPGYAIGGLSVGEPRPLSLEMTEITAPLLPREKPRYVMGVGMPEELPEYVARGVDMMDCVMPSRVARHGALFTSEGRFLIKQARFKEDASALDPRCGCYTCRSFSRAYLRHLYLAEELLFSTLATIHNLRFYLDRMREIRRAILAGSYPALLRRYRAEASGAHDEPAVDLA